MKKVESDGVSIDGDVSFVKEDEDKNFESPAEKSCDEKTTEGEGLRERFTYINESFNDYI